MGLYYSQLKNKQEAQKQPLMRTATYDPLVTPQNIDVNKQEPGYWEQRNKEKEYQREVFNRPNDDPSAILEEVSQRQLARDAVSNELNEEDKLKNLREKGNMSVVDPKTGQKRYFVDSHVNKIAGKNWEDLSLLDKFIILGEEAESIGRSVAGTAGLGIINKGLSATGGFMRQLEMINTLGQANKLQEKFGIDKTASQHVMDWANKVSDYQQKEFGTATYTPEKLTLKNIPKLLTNPEYILNGLSSAVTSGIIAKAGKLPALYALESGGFITGKRADALMKGEKATTFGEVLYSMGMGLFNAWIENFSFKIMTGSGKVPVADALISKISNNLIKGIVTWGEKVAVEMGEEFVQEGLPLLVSEAIFKDKDDVRNMFERVVDKMPEAMKQGEIAAVMALPGAVVLSGLGMMQESMIEKQNQQANNAETKMGEGVAKSFKESTNDLKLIEEGFAKNEKEGLKTNLKIIENGKLNPKIQERVTRDLTTKLDGLGSDGKLLGKYIQAGLKGKEFSSSKEYVSTVNSLIKQGMSPGDVSAFETSIENNDLNNSPKSKEDLAKIVKGEDKTTLTKAEAEKASGTVRLKDTVPAKDLKYIYQEAEKNNVTEELAKAITKPIQEEELIKLNDNQKAIMLTALESIASNEGMSSGAIVDNIQALGGTAPAVETTTELGTKAAPVSTTTIKTQAKVEKVEANIEKVTPKNIDKSIERLAKIDEDTLSKDEARKTEALSTRNTLRTKIAESLKKGAMTFVDVKTGANKPSAFTLSVKKLPNLKYGYAITMNTPSSSQAINYNPKFSTRAKAMKMGVQKAIRMIETARQLDIPIPGLTKIKSAVMAANTKLGERALKPNKIRRVIKETQKQVNATKKPKTTVVKTTKKPTSKPKTVTKKEFSSDAGSIAIGNFEQIAPKGKTKETFKLYEKTLGLVRKYATRIGEGNLSRGQAGVFKRFGNMIRLKGLNDISVAAHEIAHHLDIANTGMSEKVLRETTNGDKFRKKLTDLYEEYYPGAKRTHKLETRMVEGFATLLQKYAEMPKTIETKYPELVNAYFKEGGQFYDKVFSDIIDDLRKIIGNYQQLSALDKISARVVSENLKVDKKVLSVYERIKSVLTDFLYPFESMAKKTSKHFTRDDISLWARFYDSSMSSILANNIFGKGKFVKGYTRMVEGKPVKTLKYNWKNLVDKVSDTSDSFGAYLIARRKYFEFKEKKELESNIIKLDAELISLKEEFGDLKGIVGVKELMIQINSLKARLGDVNKIIENDQITEAEASEGYFAGKEMFKEAEEMYDNLVKEDLKFANDRLVQLISPEDYERLSTNEGYASFKRAFYDEVIGDSELIPRQMSIGKNKISSLVRRSGSSKAIINPLAGAIWNHAEFLRKGTKQIVYNKALEYLDLADIFERLKLKAIPDDNGVIHFPQEKDPNIIMARKNYKRVPILVDSTIKQIFDDVLNSQNIDAFGKFMLTNARFFTKGTTGFYSQFIFANVPIDQLAASAQSKFKYIPVYSAIKELYKTISDETSEERQFAMEYLMMGGERQTMAGWQDAKSDELIKIIRNEKEGIKKLTNFIEGTGNILGAPSTYSEIASRIVEYIKSRKAGEEPIVALERAGRVTAPFHHRGSWGGSKFLQTWVRAIPFFNPAIQVVAQPIENLTDGKMSRNKFLLVASAVGASQIAALGLLLAGGSDEQKRKYAELYGEDLAQYIFLPNFFDKKTLLKLRIPNTLSFWSTPINMMIAEKMLGTHYSLTDYYTGMTSFLPQQLNPININKKDIAKLLVGWLPQMVKVPTLVAFNKRDYPEIMPLESYAMQRKLPSERYNEYTSKVAILMGKLLGWSPTKIDALAVGFFGRFVGYFMLKPSVYQPKNIFIQQEFFNSSRQIQKYYDEKEKVEQQINTYKGNPKKRKEYNKAVARNNKLKIIQKSLDSFNDLDEDKYPIRAEQLRQKIFNSINKL